MLFLNFIRGAVNIIVICTVLIFLIHLILGGFKLVKIGCLLITKRKE